MRISTAQHYQLSVQYMQNQQVALAKTQGEISTGKRVQTPSDDPVAAVQLQQLAAQQSQLAQFGKNSTVATNRQNQEEQALSDATTLLQKVRDLVVQANTGTLTDADRQSIATQLKTSQNELLTIANRQDGNGQYLFSGTASTTQPFARGSSGRMGYQGDTGVRSVQLDNGVSVQDGDPGSRVFMDIPAGNGTFTSAAVATNAGSGVLGVGTVVDAAAWQPGNYTISFTDASNWKVTDSTGATVGTGTYTGAEGSTIGFNGVQVAISGTPAAGDSFTVASAGKQDVFSTLDNLIGSLQSGAGTDALRAQLSTALNGSLQQLDQATNTITDVRAQVGARLSMMSDADNSRANTTLSLQTASSQLGDIDYASVASKMSQQLLGLQAAQQSFASTSKLSLFNYL